MKLNLYRCEDCGMIFLEPREHLEMHNLDSPPYEHFWGCPRCGGSYSRLYKCDYCETLFVSDGIITGDGLSYCDACYRYVEDEWE